MWLLRSTLAKANKLVKQKPSWLCKTSAVVRRSGRIMKFWRAVPTMSSHIWNDGEKPRLCQEIVSTLDKVCGQSVWTKCLDKEFGPKVCGNLLLIIITEVSCPMDLSQKGTGDMSHRLTASLRSVVYVLYNTAVLT